MLSFVLKIRRAVDVFTHVVAHSLAGLLTGQEVFKTWDRVGSRGFELSRVGSGRVESGQEVLKSRGSGRIWSIGFEISRVGSQVESGVFKSHGVGSGHDPRGTAHFTDRATSTRDFFSSYLQVGPVDLTREPNTLKLCCLQGAQRKSREDLSKEGS